MIGMPGYGPIIGMEPIGMAPIGMAPIGTPMVWKLGFASMPGCYGSFGSSYDLISGFSFFCYDWTASATSFTSSLIGD